MEERLERQAQNEAMFRAVNREIETASKEVGDTELEVLCECGREGCREVIVVTATVYDSIHGQQDRFLLVAGHETPEIERVVESSGEYVIVDKFGEAEQAVEETAEA